MSERRVCLLTGAGGQLGDEFCRRHTATYDIVAVHRSRPPSVSSQEQWFVDPLAPDASLAENAYPVFSIASDLTRPGEISRVVELALARHERIDVLVNAAVHSVWGDMVESDKLLASVEQQLRVNVEVPLRLSVEVARQFWRERREENIARRRGIVNVSSIAGLNVYAGSGQSVYAASKAALNHLTRHMASEFARFGVRANALAPNTFARIVPTERVADEIARIDDGDATGEVVVVDARAEGVVITRR